MGRTEHGPATAPVMSLGPADPSRQAGAETVLDRARRAAEACGVTRLADLTRLDRIGLPVWQAVRPMGRALSVHQGKGATPSDAKVGALLEAVESHRAESVVPTGPICRFADLPSTERAMCLSDFARRRGAPPPADETHEWLEAFDLVGGGRLHLPFHLVSLDFTRGLPSFFERSSNGLAAGASRDEAIVVALHEAIERDAVTEWSARGLISCTADGLDLATVPFDWFQAWRGRLAGAGIGLRAYHVPSVTRSPTFVCELNDSRKDRAPYRATHGSGTHSIPGIALFRAMAEAIQSRSTWIAGAREDRLGSQYAAAAPGATVAFGLPLPAGWPGRQWEEIEPGPADVEGLVTALALAGYPQVAVHELGTVEGFHLVKVWVCGLGSGARRRRDPVQ
ncbi:YcaO-like family protein [Sphingosinicella sp. CPCC 101087]|uniref:YcaO-like family protein n=1 Tax=Sphingosinicella sp. CPCC 101087 TaxID=2497754 RepID=UPI00101D9B9F|nr:YcaO-like family protein [Sphingosinicella sp. CPCC 101087]